MNLRRITAAFCAAIVAVSCFAGCSSDDAEGSEKKPAETTASATEETEKLPETEEEWHRAMIEKSLYSYGNTTRMMNKIKQAQSGEKTTVAYIGGSITEGLTAGDDKCYAKLSCDYFAEKFGTGDNVEYVNAGLSGTPSKLGVLRLSRDVLAYDPDIVFIEFAVNDGNDALYKGAYESMVRRLLQLDNDVAVVLLMSITEDGHTAQDYMKQIGDYYKLPIISYADSLTYMFENQKMVWDDFSDDQSHPNVSGHALVCEMIAHYYDTVSQQPQEAEPDFPEFPCFSSRQETAEIFERSNLTPVSEGSFTAKTSTAGFGDGWAYENNGENTPAIFNVTGKFVYIIFREQPKGDLGKINVILKDGDEIVAETTVDGIQSSAWGDPGIATIHMGVEVKDYTMEIKMSNGDENKQFQILAIGVTE